MTHPDIGLSRRHLRLFDKHVTKALLSLVNDEGVRYRMPDGGHIVLYPPDGTTRPFKVSAHRPAKDSLIFIKDFADQWHLSTRGIKL